QKTRQIQAFSSRRPSSRFSSFCHHSVPKSKDSVPDSVPRQTTGHWPVEHRILGPLPYAYMPRRSAAAPCSAATYYRRCLSNHGTVSRKGSGSPLGNGGKCPPPLIRNSFTVAPALFIAASISSTLR